jgi:hypothetical protein
LNIGGRAFEEVRRLERFGADVTDAAQELGDGGT